MRFKTLLYSVEGRIARITLNRPARLNAINRDMPHEIRLAVEEANRDDNVHVIVLSGAGRAFCAGYDLKIFAEEKPRCCAAPSRPVKSTSTPSTPAMAPSCSRKNPTRPGKMPTRAMSA